MSLEVLNTVGTLATVLIVAATAIAALVQLRHLSAGNQINALLSTGDQLNSQEFRHALTVVAQKLDAAMAAPPYREWDMALLHNRDVPDVPAEYREVRDAARLVGNTHEELGILVKNGIVDKNIFLDRYSFVILGAWRRLSPLVAWVRAVSGNDGIWENFEYIAVLSEDYERERPTSYPKGVRRMELHNPWPVARANTGA